jgi:hypothetical protein
MGTGGSVIGCDIGFLPASPVSHMNGYGGALAGSSVLLTVRSHWRAAQGSRLSKGTKNCSSERGRMRVILAGERIRSLQLPDGPRELVWGSVEQLAITDNIGASLAVARPIQTAGARKDFWGDGNDRTERAKLISGARLSQSTLGCGRPI